VTLPKMGRTLAGYTTTEAAASLGLAPTTVRTQIARGRLQARKVGRDWIIRASDLEHYRSTVLGHPGRAGGRR
jgi:excisionase family DNA binding protein